LNIGILEDYTGKEKDVQRESEKMRISYQILYNLCCILALVLLLLLLTKCLRAGNL
jgi:hypothetical protein